MLTREREVLTKCVGLPRLSLLFVFYFLLSYDSFQMTTVYKIQTIFSFSTAFAITLRAAKNNHAYLVRKRFRLRIQENNSFFHRNIHFQRLSHLQRISSLGCNIICLLSSPWIEAAKYRKRVAGLFPKSYLLCMA